MSSEPILVPSDTNFNKHVIVEESYILGFVLYHRLVIMFSETKLPTKSLYQKYKCKIVKL